MMTGILFRYGVIFFAVLTATGMSYAQNVTAVLSSGLAPYQEAYQGFRETFEGEVTLRDLDTGLQLGANTEWVVAFGGKAALLPYPSHVKVVYCLAPGIQLDREAFKVLMLPNAKEVVDRLKVVQPDLRRLTILWVSQVQAEYIRALAAASDVADVEVVSERIESVDDLPESLRKALREGSNGLWLPPDPALINERSFAVLKSFSWANDIPLYVPTTGLLREGAVASVSCDFQDIGRTIGTVMQQLQNQISQPAVIYPSRVVLQVNTEAAAQVGLEIDRNDLIQKGAVVP